jgi:site-specific recombinase XerD
LKAGLRVTEAINFDFVSMENPDPKFKNLFLLRGKRQKDRYVYIEPQIIEILKENNWKPNQITRIAFGTT